MNKADYKRILGKIEPDGNLEGKLAIRMRNGRLRKSPGRAVLVVACATAAIAIGLYAAGVMPFADRGREIAGETPVPSDGVTIPKVELPKKSNAMMDMIGLFVYKGRIYTQTASSVSPEAAKSILGTKIGRTKATIDEWSKQSEFANEFASSVGERDVYTVKGYDSSFRLMTYDEADGETQVELFECMNGLTLRTGEDLFGKLKLLGNTQSARWESSDSWNNNKQDFKNVKSLDAVNAFIRALYYAKPVKREDLPDPKALDNADQNQKVVKLTLNDKSEVQLLLYKEGYAAYANIRVVYRIDSKAFQAFWELLN